MYLVGSCVPSWLFKGHIHALIAYKLETATLPMTKVVGPLLVRDKNQLVRNNPFSSGDEEQQEMAALCLLHRPALWAPGGCCTGKGVTPDAYSQPAEHFREAEQGHHRVPIS